MASETHADDADPVVDETEPVAPIVLPEFENDPETAKRILAALQALPS